MEKNLNPSENKDPNKMVSLLSYPVITPLRLVSCMASEGGVCASFCLFQGRLRYTFQRSKQFGRFLLCLSTLALLSGSTIHRQTRIGLVTLTLLSGSVIHRQTRMRPVTLTSLSGSTMRRQTRMVQNPTLTAEHNLVNRNQIWCGQRTEIYCTVFSVYGGVTIL